MRENTSEKVVALLDLPELKMIFGGIIHPCIYLKEEFEFKFSLTCSNIFYDL